MEALHRTPNLAASTTDTYSCSISQSRARERKAKDGPNIGTPPASANENSTRIEDEESNYFKSAQWTPDGTSILTSSADNTIRAFIIPPTLLDSSSSPITLTPYTSHQYPTSINCLAPYPEFSLSDPSTTLYLSALNALPIRLSNALLPIAAPISTYNLISPTTEAYLTPSSLIWSAYSHFLTGTDSLIALFDISHTGEGPVTRLPTIPSKRHKLKGGGVGMRGIVSAMSLQPSSAENGEESAMLAAGTWTRWVGLYDMAGLGGTVATWSIAEAADEMAGIGGGGGVHQTAWSKCGKYLFVVERRSRGVLVYDVRVTGKLVSWLQGREAETNQRLSIDVFGAESGCGVWAGGIDGVVRVWENVGMTEGAMDRSWEWKAHGGHISSTIVHSSGTVVATCSGQRTFPGDRAGDDDDSEASGSSGDISDKDDDSEDGGSENEYFSSRSESSTRVKSQAVDNSLKIWSL